MNANTPQPVNNSNLNATKHAPDYGKWSFYAAVIFGIGSIFAGYHIWSLQFPKNKKWIDPSSIHSPMGIDYKNLSDNLKSGDLKAADQETSRILRRLFKAESKNKIPQESIVIAPIPYGDLQCIDRLWGQIGENHPFGFTPQLMIWKDLKRSGESDPSCYEVFGERVGWRDASNANKWILDGDKFTYSVNAPSGHLPTVWNMGLRGSYGSFLNRLLDASNQQKAFQAVR